MLNFYDIRGYFFLSANFVRFVVRPRFFPYRR
jgi:hypothetical protein